VSNIDFIESIIFKSSKFQSVLTGEKTVNLTTESIIFPPQYLAAEGLFILILFCVKLYKFREK